MKKYSLWTNDVETTSIWFNQLRKETGKKVLDEGLPKLLDLYDTFSIKSTFFITGYIARLFPKIVKLISERGHEIASHGMYHTNEYSFDIMPIDKQVFHLLESKKILEDISGEKVISFRAPALRVCPITATALIESGFLIDSSVASQRFDFFLSFGSITKFNWISSPRLPYHTSNNNIFKRGDSNLVEIPLSAFIFPYVGTFMRISPFLNNIIRYLLSRETIITGKPIVFDIHPNEFIDESNEPRVINRRSKSFLSYLLTDLFRSKLKVRNLGYQALNLYEDQLIHFQKLEFISMTLKDYCIAEGLL